MRIAVTGNIGSGKSTVCQILRQKLPEYVFFSVDEAVKKVYTIPEVIECLEVQFQTAKQKEIAKIFWADATFKNKVEQIFAPYLEEMITDFLIKNPKSVVEFPTLLEQRKLGDPSWINQFDYSIAVVCDANVRQKRVFARDGLNAEQFQLRAQNQLSDDVKKALCDAWIDFDVNWIGVNARIGGTVERIREQEKAMEQVRRLRTRALNFFQEKEVVEQLLNAYQEPHRAYHNLDHIEQLLSQWDQVKKGAEIKHEKAIETAIWFHDVIYRVHPEEYPLNEARSARYLQDRMSTGLTRVLTHEERLLALEMIVATKTHQVDSPWILATPERGQACQLFLDLDMSILGSDAQSYECYTNGIAKEWGQDPKRLSPEFKRGRRRFLEGLLSQKIFKNERFQALEEQAHQNIRSEIQKLS